MRKKISVMQYDICWHLVKKHDSISEAAKSVNGNPSNIRRATKRLGGIGFAYGYHWVSEDFKWEDFKW